MTRNQWIVVGGLMVLILIIFGTLIFQLKVPQAVSTAAPPAFLLEEAAQAKNALPVAQQEAQNWQQDAQLASAAIVWDDFGPGGILKRDRWTFEFYSPSKKHMAVIRVVDGQPRRLRTSLLPYALPTLPMDQWQIDSTEAFETWWAQGGERFMRQHPRVSVSLKLRMEPGGTRPVWIVAGSASEQHWIVQLSSSDGTVLQ